MQKRLEKLVRRFYDGDFDIIALPETKQLMAAFTINKNDFDVHVSVLLSNDVVEINAATNVIRIDSTDILNLVNELNIYSNGTIYYVVDKCLCGKVVANYIGCKDFIKEVYENVTYNVSRGLYVIANRIEAMQSGMIDKVSEYMVTDEPIEEDEDTMVEDNSSEETDTQEFTTDDNESSEVSDGETPTEEVATEVE